MKNDNNAELQCANFNKLRELAPTFIDGERYTELISPRAPIMLIEMQRCNDELCDSSAIITQYLQSGDHQSITDIGMMLMINEKGGTVRPVSLYREGWTDSRCVYTEDNEIDADIEYKLGQFMSEWLDALGQLGFERWELEQTQDMGMSMDNLPG